jgi:pimeloyl-ACP methyl ester carboxylesterase
VFYVWGENDMELFVHPRVREQQVRFIKGPYEELPLDAGHWLMQEEPEAVTAAVMEHLQAQRR